MSTNYHKICVNVKAMFFFVLRTNFNLNLSRHFYCYLSAPCVCELWMWFWIRIIKEMRGSKRKKDKSVSVDWKTFLFPYQRTPISMNLFSSTCSNLNLTQLSTNISLRPHILTHARIEKNPHRNISNKQIVHSAFPGLDNRVKNWLNMDPCEGNKKSQPICTTTFFPCFKLTRSE